MIENDVENIGTLLACEMGEENAATENRINETGGIAGEHPALTRETCLAIRKIGACVGRGDPPGLSHAPGEKRLFGERLLKELFRRFLRPSVERRIADDADAGTALG